MKFFSFSKQGREWNEDRCNATPFYAYVLDGASSLNNENYTNFRTDSEWYSDWWDKFLRQKISDTSKTIPEILTEGIKQVVEAYEKISDGKKISDFPSSTISVIRINGENLEFFALGDSPILVKTKSGMILKIADTLNNVNDTVNMAIIKELADKNKLDYLEARNKFPESINSGRMRKNTPGNYYVLSNSVEALNHAVLTKMNLSIVEKVIVLSDGFYQLHDVFHFYSDEKLISKIDSLDSAEKLYKKLFKAQEKDPFCNKFLRFKIRDDSSIAMLDFKD